MSLPEVVPTPPQNGIGPLDDTSHRDPDFGRRGTAPRPRFDPVPPPAPGPSVQVTVTDITPPALPRLDELLEFLVANGHSDLHLHSGQVPRSRVHGNLEPIPGVGAYPQELLEQIIQSLISSEAQRDQYARTGDLDIAYALGDRARFRVSLLRDRGRPAAVLRTIPTRVLTVDELKVPEHLRTLAGAQRGLVLVTGPTGSGKSTLLASLVDLANRTRRSHILTIEDPVEFVHTPRLATITQREVGRDTDSFASGLRGALRQDPDIILLGELRDLETSQAAIEAADTGHLVFGTMHTRSAPETISRYINIFPKEVQAQISTTLASSLVAVISQTLVQTIDGKGRVAAQEVMILDSAIRSLVRQGKIEQIQSNLQSGAEAGMQTMDAHLAQLVATKTISYETALATCANRQELDSKLARLGMR